MSDTINIHDWQTMYQESYSPRLISALRDNANVISPYMTMLDDCTGSAREMNTIGSTAFKRRTGRLQKIVREELSFGKRFIRPELFSAHLVMSKDDLVLKGKFAATASDLTVELKEAGSQIVDEVALGVEYDSDLGDYTIRASVSGTGTSDGSPYNGETTGGIFGDAYTGELGNVKRALPQQPYFKSDGLADDYSDYSASTISDSLDLKLTNVIPLNYVVSGTQAASNLTIEKILAAKTALLKRGAIRKGELVCLAITPEVEMEILTWEKTQNVNYGWQTLKDGIINTLLGIKLMVCPKLPLVNIGTSSSKTYVRSLPMWVPRDAVLGTWDNPKFKVVELDQDYEDAIQISASCGYGSGRKREESFISIHVAE